jgi:hypothetical protein
MFDGFRQHSHYTAQVYDMEDGDEIQVHWVVQTGD